MEGNTDASSVGSDAGSVNSYEEVIDFETKGETLILPSRPIDKQFVKIEFFGAIMEFFSGFDRDYTELRETPHLKDFLYYSSRSILRIAYLLAAAYNYHVLTKNVEEFAIGEDIKVKDLLSYSPIILIPLLALVWGFFRFAHNLFFTYICCTGRLEEKQLKDKLSKVYVELLASLNTDVYGKKVPDDRMILEEKNFIYFFLEGIKFLKWSNVRNAGQEKRIIRERRRHIENKPGCVEFVSVLGLIIRAVNDDNDNADILKSFFDDINGNTIEKSHQGPWARHYQTHLNHARNILKAFKEKNMLAHIKRVSSSNILQGTDYHAQLDMRLKMKAKIHPSNDSALRQKFISKAAANFLGLCARSYWLLFYTEGLLRFKMTTYCFLFLSIHGAYNVWNFQNRWLALSEYNSYLYNSYLIMINTSFFFFSWFALDGLLKYVYNDFKSECENKKLSIYIAKGIENELDSIGRLSGLTKPYSVSRARKTLKSNTPEGAEGGARKLAKESSSSDGPETPLLKAQDVPHSQTLRLRFKESHNSASIVDEISLLDEMRESLQIFISKLIEVYGLSSLSCATIEALVLSGMVHSLKVAQQWHWSFISMDDQGSGYIKPRKLKLTNKKLAQGASLQEQRKLAIEHAIEHAVDGCSRVESITSNDKCFQAMKLLYLHYFDLTSFGISKQAFIEMTRDMMFSFALIGSLGLDLEESVRHHSLAMTPREQVMMRKAVEQFQRQKEG